MDNPQSWQVQRRFLELHSRWLSLIGEDLQDHQGNQLEYWRIEKADSVVVLPIQSQYLLLPSPSYRPGVGQVTLDFPGGRVAAGQTPEDAARVVLHRELGIEVNTILQLRSLNTTGWIINSSFSNQRLFGFVAELDPRQQPSQLVAETYSIHGSGVQALLQKLSCLQCRALLLEWWMTQTSSEHFS